MKFYVAIWQNNSKIADPDLTGWFDTIEEVRAHVAKYAHLRHKIYTFGFSF